MWFCEAGEGEQFGMEKLNQRSQQDIRPLLQALAESPLSTQAPMRQCKNKKGEHVKWDEEMSQQRKSGEAEDEVVVRGEEKVTTNIGRNHTSMSLSKNMDQESCSHSY